MCAAVDAARAAGDLGEDTEVHVALPGGPVGPSWLGAADELAAAELGLVLPADGAGADLLAGIDAALDRELTFRCRGLSRAYGAPRGFRHVLVATAMLFDGLSGAGEAIDADEATLAGVEVDAGRARRWFTGFASTEPERSVADLRALDGAA